MGNDILKIWFELYELMLAAEPQPFNARMPTLRDACYVHVVRQRLFPPDASTHVIEVFVNGLELGATVALRACVRAVHGETA